MVNELLQWIAIAGTALMAIALLRQFGALYLGGANLALDAFGPSVGSPADERLMWLFRADVDYSSDQSFCALVVSEGCPICEELMAAYADEYYQQWESTLSRGPSPVGWIVVGSFAFAESVRDRMPEGSIVDTFDHMYPGKAPPKGFPVGILLDRDHRVVDKRIGADVLGLMEMALNLQSEKGTELP